MSTAIQNRDDPAALVPLIVKAPAEQLEHVKHVTFATPLSAEVEGMRETAIRRLALGLDMPPEVLTGMGDANHWSGWQIEESAVKGTVEPMLELICHALTTGYLLPVLGLKAAETNLMVWYDTSELTQRPDRSGAAGELWDRGELSGDALRRESGFGLEDAPRPDERRRRTLEKLIAADPGVTPAILELLGYVQPGDLPSVPAIGEQEPPALDEPAPGEPAEQRALPARPPAGDEPQPEPVPAGGAASATAASTSGIALGIAWGAVAGTIARHAMDYAGKRLLRVAGRAHRGRHEETLAWELHCAISIRDELGGNVERLLENAYDPFAGTPVFERCHGLIDRHVRMALLSGQPLDVHALERDAAVLARDALARGYEPRLPDAFAAEAGS
jgi:hypothetical protein